MTTTKVGLSGLVNGQVDADSLYMVTVNLSGATPVASNLHKVASGIRNVVGMGFQTGTGDFYFVDNAIDGPGPLGDDPPQAEELNRITAAQLSAGVPLNFGYPNCYTEYRTGNAIGSGCVQPVAVFQPIPNGSLLGSESEGATQLAFAPANFPTGFNNGVFVGFFGKGSTGPANEENGVGYYDFGTGNFTHFVENSQNGVHTPIGLMSTNNSLFIADYYAGIVYEVTATPEPSSLLLSLAGIAALGLARKQLRPLN